MIKVGLLILLFMVVVLIMLPCLLGCMLKMFKSSVHSFVLFEVKQNMGDVGIGLGGSNRELEENLSLKLWKTPC